MTITSQVSFVQLPGNGSATVFAAPMKCFAAADVVVGLIVGGVYQYQTGGYSVTNIDTNGGFNVVFSTPPPTGVTVDIRTLTALLQSTEFANLGQFLPESHTDALDRLTRMIQDLKRLTYLFGLHGPDNESVPWTALPPPAYRAGMYLSFDANGQPTLAPLLAPGVTLTPQMITNLIFPQTVAEAAQNVFPANTAYQSGPMRYGAAGDGVSDDAPAFNTMGTIGGFQLIPDAPAPNFHYRLASKFQTSSFFSFEGTTRQSTTLQGDAFSDYVIEIGANPLGPNPNVCALKRIRVQGNTQNTALMHLNQLSHLFHLDEILFSGSNCGGLVIDNCWDSNYTNLDFQAVGRGGSIDMTRDAALIIKAGCNNLYLRGIRVEVAPCGAIYCNGASVHIVEGKVDNEFGATQGAGTAAINVDVSGSLSVDEFYIGGQLTYQAIVQGSLKLGKVVFDGGSNQLASIKDIRAWKHLDPSNFAGISANFIGPSIPVLDLGLATFTKSHPSSIYDTPAAVYSKIPVIRYVVNCSVTANGSVSGNTIQVATNLPGSINDLYKNCVLVHNATGTQAQGQAGSRRVIRNSFPGGLLVLAGTFGATLDGDWSVEYCPQHATPINTGNANLGAGQTMFAVLASDVTITTTPTYVTSTTDPAYGCTKFGVNSATSTNIFAGFDATGFYLIDNATGEPYFVNYGIDGSGYLAVMYDRSATSAAAINSGSTFTLQAGYAANIRRTGAVVEWNHGGIDHKALVTELAAAGYAPHQAPLWGFGLLAQRNVDALVTVPYSATMTLDAAAGNCFEISATNVTAFAIANPANVNQPGQCLVITIRNTSGAALGAASWGGLFKMAAWTQPATGYSRSIEFRFNGTNLVERNRTPADVPN